MRDLRFNIAGILGAIVFAGVGFAALRQADDLWDSGLFSVTIALLLAAVLLAVHGADARRGFWIGVALFGWGYWSLSLIPSTESRLITTKALTYLDQSNANAIRASLKLDRMRAYNVSVNDVIKAVTPSTLIGQATAGPPVQLSQTPQSVDIALNVGRHNKPEQYGNIILKASPDGEILRVKDIAEVWLSASWYARAGTTANFIRIGHSLFALLIAWLGGVLSRRLGRVS